MSYEWPQGFVQIPAEDWVDLPLERLAMKYDTVEEHGWYDNLNPSVQQILEYHGAGDLLLDYSGGTGILTKRLYEAAGDRAPGVLIVDSSPKFLRLALEKFRDDPRVGYRLIRYLREERRLQRLDEVLGGGIQRVDAIASTNAIHLYYELPATLQSWYDILRPGGRVFVQSGNIRNPDAPEGCWIIDETVEHIHRIAMEIVADTPAFQDYQSALQDSEFMAAHDKLRAKYFLPVRHVDHYKEAFLAAGFSPTSCTTERIQARVADWFDFLSVYHEGVLGWVGGAQKITGHRASDTAVSARRELMKLAMARMFDGRDSFDAVWTYFIYAR
ncbi:MAG: hypothetical protein CMH54_03255 [Myxococcales bacterium]|nr:hypothetical protein [Myxococcales bacterium]